MRWRTEWRRVDNDNGGGGMVACYRVFHVVVS